MDILAAYPRTGTNFLQLKVEPGTFDRTHEILTEDQLSNYDRVITLVRYPLETVASSISMGIWQGAESVEDFKTKIPSYLNNYTQYLKWLISINAVFIHNQDLHRIDDVISFLGYKRGSLELKIENFFKENAIPSSIDLPYYDKVYKEVSLSNMSDAIEIYKMASMLCHDFGIPSV